MNFDIGYCNPGFVTDTTRKVVDMDKPYILVTNYALENIRVSGGGGSSSSRS